MKERTTSKKQSAPSRKSGAAASRSGSKSSRSSVKASAKAPARGSDARNRKTHAPAQAYAEFPEREDILIGRNPVTEALKSKRPIEKIIVQDGAGGSLGRVISLAKDRGVMVETVDKRAIERLVGNAPHQGVIAITSAHEYASLDDVFAIAKVRGEYPFIIVLDGIEDPHNLGAIIRTAECAGAHGVIIPKRRAAGVTYSAAKSSAGAVEYVPCVRVANIAQTVEELKDRGVWVYACDMDGDAYNKAKLTGPVALVIGSEGDGISRLVKEKCDFVISIPMYGNISSLNASNAAAILMYEIRRQREEW